MQAMIGSDRPPQTIHVNQADQSLQVTVLGKQITQPRLTLGDQWSRQMESTKNQFGGVIDRLSFDTGRTLQTISRTIMEWIGVNLGDLLHRAVAS